MDRNRRQSPKPEAQRLASLAANYVTDQVESKFQSESWGKVNVELTFRCGELAQVDIVDHTVLRPENLKAK